MVRWAARAILLIPSNHLTPRVPLPLSSLSINPSCNRLTISKKQQEEEVLEVVIVILEQEEE